MNIFLSLSAAPGIASNKLVVAIYDSSAPSTVVASQVFNAPHIAPVNIEFTNLDPLIYIIKTWESPDGSASGVLRHSFIATPESQNTVSREDLFITAGPTTGFNGGDNQYIDTSLAQWNYTVEQRGVGSLKPGIDIQIFATGGWGFINGYVIQDQETFVMHFQATITIQSGVTSQIAGRLYADEVTVAATTVLDATYLGKVIKLASTSAAVFDVTLPPSNTSPNMKQICFMSEGGAHKMVNIKASGSDTISCLGQNLTSVSLAQDEEIEMYNYNGTWRIKSPVDFFKMVGELVYSMSKLIPNTLLCDGRILSRAQYPRLWNFINTKLDPSLLISETAWNLQDSTVGSETYLLYPNKIKFSTGDGTTTFRLPVLVASTAFGAKDDSNNPRTIGGFLRGIDDTQRMPGTIQVDGVGNFKASIEGPTFQFHYSGNAGEKFTGLGTAPGGITPIDTANAISGKLFKGSNAASNRINYETTVMNVGAYLALRY